MDELQKLKEIFLADDVDSEDYQDNLDQITEWEKDLIENESMESWQQHDVTKKIVQEAIESYVTISARIASDRKMNDEERKSLWARQDACLWIVNLASTDAKSVLQSIKKKIRTAINATK